MRADAPHRGRASAARAAGILAALAFAGCAGEPRGPCRPDPAPEEVGSICGFQNPEDVEWIPEAGILVVSNMAARDGSAAGHLSALDLPGPQARPSSPFRLWPPREGVPPRGAPLEASDCADPPSASDFAPHGIASVRLHAGPLRLVVVNHGRGERIELFDVAGRGRRTELTWRGCFALPPGMVANDLSLAPDGTLAVTRYGSHWGGARQILETVAAALGRDTGEVRIRRPGGGFEPLPGTEGPSPNGVWLAPDGSRVVTAHTGSGQVVRVGLAGGGVARVEVPGHPDNLSLSPGGVLRVATHLGGLQFLRCALGGGPCRSPFAVLEVREPGAAGRAGPAPPGPGLATREILRHDGSAVGAVASVAEAFGRLYLGAVFGDRIGVWRLPAGGARPP